MIKNRFFSVVMLLLFTGIASSSELNIKEYCNYKESAGSLTINIPLIVKYSDGFTQKTQVNIECRYGTYCFGFRSGGEYFNSGVFESIKIKHMSKELIVLTSGYWDEFLFDIRSRNFRWTQGDPGLVTEKKCNIITND